MVQKGFSQLCTRRLAASGVKDSDRPRIHPRSSPEVARGYLFIRCLPGAFYEHYSVWPDVVFPLTAWVLSTRCPS